MNQNMELLKNTVANYGNWTIAKWKEFISAHGAPISGTKDILEERVLKIHQLQKINLEVM